MCNMYHRHTNSLLKIQLIDDAMNTKILENRVQITSMVYLDHQLRHNVVEFSAQ